jgi:hypothetical protein
LQSGPLPPELVPAVENEEITLTASPCLQLDPVPKTVNWNSIVMRIWLTLTLENDLEVRVIVRMEEVFTLPPLFLEDSWRNYQKFFTYQHPLKWAFLIPPSPGGILANQQFLPGFLVVPQE